MPSTLLISMTRQIGIVQHVDAVLARWKFGVAHVELEWDLGFKVAKICACAGVG